MIKNNRFLLKTLLSVAIGALLAMMVAPTLALPVAIASYSSTNYSNSYNSNDATLLKRGQAFNSTIGLSITSVTLNLQRELPCTDAVFNLDIWNCTGTPGVNATPSVLLYRLTDAYDCALLPADTVVDVNIPITELAISQNTAYAIVWNVTSTTGGGYIRLGIDDTAPTDPGNAVSWGGASWSSSPGHDLLFVVYGETGSGTPTIPTVYGGVTDATINAFVAFAVPLLVTLLPMLLLIVVTRSTDKWVILIGITVGAGLGYYFNMVPLWLVFLITIGLIGMAYQSVRGGNS